MPWTSAAHFVPESPPASGEARAEGPSLLPPCSYQPRTISGVAIPRGTVRSLGCPHSPGSASRRSCFPDVLSSHVSSQAHQSPGQSQPLTALVDGDPCLVLKRKFTCLIPSFSNPSPASHLLVVFSQLNGVQQSSREEREKKPGACLWVYPGAKVAGEMLAWPESCLAQVIPINA